MSKQPLFKVVFMSQGQIYEIYARNVGHGAMFGFEEIEELVFGERSSVVVDPSGKLDAGSQVQFFDQLFGGADRQTMIYHLVGSFSLFYAR